MNQNLNMRVFEITIKCINDDIPEAQITITTDDKCTSEELQGTFEQALMSDE